MMLQVFAREASSLCCEVTSSGDVVLVTSSRDVALVTSSRTPKVEELKP